MTVRDDAENRGASLRLQLRRGELARDEREDPNGTLEEREPDELMNASGDFEFLNLPDETASAVEPRIEKGAAGPGEALTPESAD